MIDWNSDWLIIDKLSSQSPVFVIYYVYAVEKKKKKRKEKKASGDIAFSYKT